MTESKIPRVRPKRRKGGSPAQARLRSGSAAAVSTDGYGVITVSMRTKAGQVTVIRSSRTGRFTAAKSAKVIDRGAERFASTLKRLATK